MARIYPAELSDGTAAATLDERLLARLAGELGVEWRVICRASGPLILLNRRVGIVLLDSALAAGRDAAAIAAFEAELAELGFELRFPGHLPILALAAPSADEPDFGAFLEREIGSREAPGIADRTWAYWLARRLAAGNATDGGAAPLRSAPPRGAGVSGLQGPVPDEGWRVAEAAPAVRVRPERTPQARDLEARSPLFAGMALAVLVLAVVLAAMAMLSYGNGP